MKLLDLSGILPRTAVFIINEVKRLKSYIYTEIKVEISSLEIYCDTVKDVFSEKMIELFTDKNQKIVLKG